MSGLMLHSPRAAGVFVEVLMQHSSSPCSSGATFCSLRGDLQPAGVLVSFRVPSNREHERSHVNKIKSYSTHRVHQPLVRLGGEKLFSLLVLAWSLLLALCLRFRQRNSIVVCLVLELPLRARRVYILSVRSVTVTLYCTEYTPSMALCPAKSLHTTHAQLCLLVSVGRARTNGQ